MPTGIRVWNADGTLQFDTSGRLFRSITDVTTGTANGSVSVVVPTGATVIVATTEFSEGAATPDVTVSGANVSWNFGSNTLKTSTHLRIMVF